jgi:hypothetical protein
MSTRTIAVMTRNTVQVSASITRPANTTAYTAGDVLANVTDNNYLTFSEVSSGRSNTGMLHAVRVITSQNATTKPDLDLFLFSATIVEVADNGAAAFTDAEMLTCVGRIAVPVAGFVAGAIAAAGAGNAVCEVRNIDMPYVAAGQTLYGQLVARNAYAPISGEVFTVQLILSLD